MKKVRFILPEENTPKYYNCDGCGKKYRYKRAYNKGEPMHKKPIIRDHGKYCHIVCTMRNPVYEMMQMMLEMIEKKINIE